MIQKKLDRLVRAAKKRVAKKRAAVAAGIRARHAKSVAEHAKRYARTDTGRFYSERAFAEYHRRRPGEGFVAALPWLIGLPLLGLMAARVRHDPSR